MRIVRFANNHPRVTRREILAASADPNITVSRRTVCIVLKRTGLNAGRPRKTPLFQPRHIKARIAFANRHIDRDSAFWTYVLWTDETKIEFFGHNNVAHLYRKCGVAHLPRTPFPPRSMAGKI